MKKKIYLETTVFNYYFDKNRKEHKDTLRLFELIYSGEFEAYTSQYALDEIGECYEPKRSKMYKLVDNYNIIVLGASDEAKRLMRIYINEGMVPRSSEEDGLHIATASINNVDAIISLNFNHINRAKTKLMIQEINEKEGYKEISILSPLEVVDNGKS